MSIFSHQTLAEPCLYYRFEVNDTNVNVDHILVATNNARCKNIFFTELNDAYEIKDQGGY